MLSLDPDNIEQRLYARVSRFEMVALAILLFIQWGFVYFRSAYGENVAGIDLNAFYDAVDGDLWGFFYAPWVLPIFAVMQALPGEIGYFLWGTANIAALFFAARVFGGITPIVLVSYQALYMAFFGQITGITCMALALVWWGLARRWWHVAGLGLLLASTKFQIGLTYGLVLWLTADISWRERLQCLLVPVSVSILTLVVDLSWPLDLLERIQNSPPDQRGSISLWTWIGPFALLLWLPMVLLPLNRSQRLVGVGATAVLALPYFQQNDLLHLFILPVGYLPLLGNLGFAFGILGPSSLRLLSIVAIIAYLWVLGDYRRYALTQTDTG